MGNVTAAWKGPPSELLKMIQLLPLMLTGRAPDPTGEVRRLYIRLGLVALSIIRTSFIIKARGGTDAAGIRWKPLAASTVRSRLRKAKLPTERQARRELEEARATVARTGRGQKKLERAKARAGKVFNPTLEILRDTGRLLMSLSPVLAGPGAQASTPGVPPGVAQPPSQAGQIFNIRPGFVDVGTNVVYGGAHHYGTSRIPRRQLWADWAAWPPPWKSLVESEIQQGLQRLLAALLLRGRRS